MYPLVHGSGSKVNNIAFPLPKVLAAATNQSAINLDFCAFLQKTANAKLKSMGRTFLLHKVPMLPSLAPSFLLMVVYSVLSLLFFRSGKTDYQEVSV